MSFGPQINLILKSNHFMCHQTIGKIVCKFGLIQRDSFILLSSDLYIFPVAVWSPAIKRDKDLLERV